MLVAMRMSQFGEKYRPAPLTLSEIGRVFVDFRGGGDAFFEGKTGRTLGLGPSDIELRRLFVNLIRPPGMNQRELHRRETLVNTYVMKFCSKDKNDTRG